MITVDPTFMAVLAAALCGLLLSVIIEYMMSPRPIISRPWAAWALHVGLWLFPFALLTLLLGRPWFAAAAVSAFLLMLVLVNNAKFAALREPFVFQDYEYFTDAIRHPRLYIPFLGWPNFFGASAGFVSAALFGLWIEEPFAERFMINGQLCGVAFIFFCGALSIWLGNRKTLPVSFEPIDDVKNLGLLPCAWRYAEEMKNNPIAASPFDYLEKKYRGKELPHLLAVQSESFFDPREICNDIQQNILSEFDLLKKDAFAHGKLEVPAWGANTVRTEFAFLTGLQEKILGVHRFNPFRAISGGWQLSSIAMFLQGMGYRTVCIHPYPITFYRRNRVYPVLGFDEFIDIRAFDKVHRSGAYIGDMSVADKVKLLMESSKEPLFLFVITMENHGPHHLEAVAPKDVADLYEKTPRKGSEELNIYLRHLCNADLMIGRLREILERCTRPASLCWFADHVPIMPSVYKAYGEPTGAVEYVFWHNRDVGDLGAKNLKASDLSMAWLRGLGFF
jgi:hypothetical protein